MSNLDKLIARGRELELMAQENTFVARVACRTVLPKLIAIVEKQAKALRDIELMGYKIDGLEGEETWNIQAVRSIEIKREVDRLASE